MFDADQLVESIAPGDRLAAALALIDAELDTVYTTDLCDELVTEQLLETIGVADRVGALMMVRAAAWEPRRTWENGLARNARGWLTATTDMTSEDALQLLRCGRLVAGHEMLAKHLRAGELSCRKIDAIARVVTDKRKKLFARDEHILLHHLSGLSGDQAARLMNRWKALCDDALANDDATEQHQRRRFHHSRTANTWHTNGQFDLDDGAIIDAALRDAMGDPDPADRPGGARTPAQRRADALTKISLHWLNARNHVHATNPAATVNLHIDHDTLTGSSEDGFDPDAVCDLVPGGPISRDSARRMLCDCYLNRIVLDAKGEPIDLGRTQRFFTPAQKRAMVARDGDRCVVPKCLEPVEFCDAHHLNPFEAGGGTDLDNGAFVCRNHHGDIHQRGYTLARAPNGWTFTHPTGHTWTE